MKRLMFLISTEGKTLEEMEKEVSLATETYQKTSEKQSQKEKKEKKD